MNPYNNFQYNNKMNPSNNRFGGGFFGPFILGGIAGSLITSRPNQGYYYPVYYPYPYYQSYPYYY